MTLSAQNTILPHLGADIRPDQPEASQRACSALTAHLDPPVNLLTAIKSERLSPKVTLDENGNWVTRDIRRMRVGNGELELPLTGPFLQQSALRGGR